MTPSLELELRAHAAALRSLARDLVGEGDADDLVQDVAVQALTKPPRDTGPVAGWLFTVVRRLASKHRRGTRRRRAREERAAVPEALRAADAAAADCEVFRRLSDAVLALPEPYRTVVLLRYLREQPARAIAAQLDVPLATVKTRLARGLALLRQRLSAQGFDWRAALGATFGIERAAPVGTALAAGGIIVGTGVKLACGAVAAAVIVAIGLTFFRDGAVPTSVGAADAVEPAVAAANVGATPGADARRTLAPSPSPSAKPRTATVRGRCVDAEGQPLAGCTVRVHGVPASFERRAAWERAHGAFAWTDPEPITTGADGAFVLSVEPTGPFAAELSATLEARAAQMRRWPRLAAGEERDVGDLVVPRSVLVRVRAVDVQRVALPDLTLWFHGDDVADATRAPFVAVVTDAAGRAEVMLPEGEHCVMVGMVNAWDRLLRVPGDAPEFDVELQIEGLRAVATLGGTVIDAAGRPIAAALIHAIGADGERTSSSARTTAEGRFTLGRPSEFSDAPPRVRCMADGHDGWTSPEPIAWGTRDVQIVLREGSSAEFRVVDAATGAGIERFELVAESADPGRYDELWSRGFHDDGVALLDPLPRGAYKISVVPDDTSWCARFSERIAVDDAPTHRFEIALARSAARTLRVQRADGTPVAGATFELLANTQRDGDGRPGVKTWTVSLAESLNSWGNDQALRYAMGSTDAAGEAVLRGAADQQFALRVTGADVAPCVTLDVSLAQAGALVVVPDAGAPIHGTIGPESFLASMRAANRGAGGVPRVALRTRGGGLADLGVPVAADGTFVTGGLTPGDWQLTLEYEVQGRDPMRHELGTVAVGDDEPAPQHYDLSALVLARATGVASVDGAPAARADILLLPRTGDGGTARFTEGRTDAAGRFALWTTPGEYAVELGLEGSARDQRLRVADRVELVPGEDRQHAWEVRTAQLRVRLVDPGGGPVASSVMLCDTAGRGRFAGDTDVDGRFEQRIEAGAHVLSTWPAALRTDAARERFIAEHPRDPAEALARERVQLGTVVLAPGETAWRTILVPAAAR